MAPWAVLSLGTETEQQPRQPSIQRIVGGRWRQVDPSCDAIK